MNDSEAKNIRKITIRLIIPECKNFDGSYCCYGNGHRIDNDDRIAVLKESCNLGDGENIGLIVTSHNFFSYYPDRLVKGKNFIEEKVIHDLNSLPKNIPLVLGFDLATKRISFNPFNGIDAIVCFFNIENNEYKYSRHIWEVWESDDPNPSGFLEQNRTFDLCGFKIGLLSCGDISPSCHCDGVLLPEVDIYLDLSHVSLSGCYTPQKNQPPKIINDYKTHDNKNKAKYVFVTQQVKDTNKYTKDKKYSSWIFGENITHDVKEYIIDDENKGVFVDITIHEAVNV